MLTSVLSLGRFGLLALLAVVCLPIPGLGQDTVTDLPIEYYFGRWAEGAAVDLRGRWSEEFNPDLFGRIQITTQQSQTGLTGLAGNRLIPWGDTDVKSLSGYSLWRPQENWQVGLANVTYVEDSWLSPNVSRTGHPVAYEQRIYSGQFVSTWSNRDNIRLPAALTPYAYFVNPVVGDGAVIWRSQAGLSYERQQQPGGFVLFPPNEIFSILDSTLAYHWHFANAVEWGISERIVIGGEANLSIIDSRSAEYDPTGVGSDDTPDREEELRVYRPSYLFAGLLIPSYGTYVTVAFGQEFEDRSRVFRYNPEGPGTGYESSTDYAIEEVRTGGSAAIDFFTGPSLPAEIILDDYGDFYRHMLLPGQTHHHLEFDYLERSPLDYSESKQAGLMFESATGFGDNWEFRSRVDYDWRRQHRAYHYPEPGGVYLEEVATEEVTFRFTGRWRSYDYVPGEGPGWYRDTPIDIAYGPIPGPGQAYLSLAYIPPRLRSGDEDNNPSFFQIDALSNNGEHTLVPGA
ncbi:hypothetical protein GF420_12275, partial [candidate division GN15 bacterium]|nr:hypothetical protein [candidate division GN15 bacterium]